MTNSQVEIGSLSPAIDRFFRFLEMIGVTALIAAVLREPSPFLSKLTVQVGSSLAFFYLIEPSLDYLTRLFLKSGRWSNVLVIGTTTGLASIFGTDVAGPYVIRLVERVMHTISVTG